jgi:hypothetical protein
LHKASRDGCRACMPLRLLCIRTYCLACSLRNSQACASLLQICRQFRQVQDGSGSRSIQAPAPAVHGRAGKSAAEPLRKRHRTPCWPARTSEHNVSMPPRRAPDSRHSQASLAQPGSVQQPDQCASQQQHGSQWQQQSQQQRRQERTGACAIAQLITEVQELQSGSARIYRRHSDLSTLTESTSTTAPPMADLRGTPDPMPCLHSIVLAASLCAGRPATECGIATDAVGAVRVTDAEEAEDAAEEAADAAEERHLDEVHSAAMRGLGYVGHRRAALRAKRAPASGRDSLGRLGRSSWNALCGGPKCASRVAQGPHAATCGATCVTALTVERCGAVATLAGLRCWPRGKQCARQGARVPRWRRGPGGNAARAHWRPRCCTRAQLVSALVAQELAARGCWPHESWLHEAAGCARLHAVSASALSRACREQPALAPTLTRV